MSDHETARLARAYVVARERRPKDFGLHLQRYRELRALVDQDLKLSKPVSLGDEPASEDAGERRRPGFHMDTD